MSTIAYRVEVAEGCYHVFGDGVTSTPNHAEADTAFRSYPQATLEELHNGEYNHTLDQSSADEE
jgi:hypothetical protein